MNSTERVLLDLIKCSLFGIAPDFPANTDWDAVLLEAKLQTVVGIAAQAVPPEQRKAWARDEWKLAAHVLRNAHAQSELLQLFNAQHIPVAVLKGDAVSVYYPAPEHRMVGDIDLIVPPDRFLEARQLMEDHGYVISHIKGGGSIRHIGYRKNGVQFELHHHFSYSDLSIERYLEEGLRHIETGHIAKRTFPMLPKLGNGMVLLAHMRYHLQGGMGLRQVIDWMMYADRELDDAFWQESFRAAAADVGMEKLAVVMTRMCQKYLGLKASITWCRKADEALCDTLMEELLAAGNFGQKEGKDDRLETVVSMMRREGFFRYLQHAGEYNWRAYHAHRWLKPLCPVYQIFRYAKQGISAGRKDKKLLGSVRRGNRKYDLLRDLGIG